MTSTYSSKIIKAGALIPDSRIFLRAYDGTMAVGENLRWFREQNLLAKSSRSRVNDILPIFRQRFLDNPRTRKALLVLAKGDVDTSIFERILYYHTALADPLVYQFAADYLFERYRSGDGCIVFDDAARSVMRMGASTGSTWSRDTGRRITQGLLSTMRDYHILEGAVNKRISSPYLPVEAFVYIATAINDGGVSGRALVDHRDWRLFLLTPTDVERLFIEADGEGFLKYHAAGQIARIYFKNETPEEFAHGVVGRKNTEA